MTGTPTDAALGRRLAGGIQLAVAGDIPLRDLGTKLDDYFNASQLATYRTNFPWVDNLSEVRDRAKHDQLDALLVERIAIGRQMNYTLPHLTLSTGRSSAVSSLVKAGTLPPTRNWS